MSSDGRGGPSALDAAADDWLVAKARSGSMDAWEVLIHRHRDRIYRIALRMVGSPEDAEDIAQDVVLQLWTALASFAGNSMFTTWLYRVVVNRCINHVTGSRRHDELAESDLAPAPGADDQAVARHRLRAAISAVLDLPPELRAAIVLVDIEQLSYHEAAAILDIPESTVRGRLHRARRRLLDHLQAWT
ncbi:RNA polymerase sigma factor [Pseudonocardia sp. GCM10023141]|uniref:RNA polymerase sigma factor n=1 Tax=Pseudonocardia sp. GCM10023141 TaxID=3252653 RepID=UPI0036D2F0D5